jgi:hypothetical protein
MLGQHAKHRQLLSFLSKRAAVKQLGPGNIRPSTVRNGTIGQIEALKRLCPSAPTIHTGVAED